MCLRIVGPIPDGFPSDKLDTPYWGVPPPTVLPPSVLPYDHIKVEKLHLPSFKHVSNYVMHIRHASKNVFEELTWDSDVQDGPIHFCDSDVLLEDRDYMLISANKCTDNFLLCLQVTATHSLSLLSILFAAERRWIILFATWFRKSVAGNSHDLHCTMKSAYED
ncbi:hypothetical protein BDY19DRAFT_6683 [Irpex rosettiformis]|uniref:Uncharacterized protein n=1 Tax=Irpex rosettiformis TaxID=378272 RepID=A0ACB8UIN9_9APHY|nr:hypothetical protein BDY19DRAFT_6683 [Irpex rosettiformis]